MQKKSTNHEPYTTSTQWMESWNSIENASRIMLRPWLQKRINHFYRDRGRENNNSPRGNLSRAKTDCSRSSDRYGIYFLLVSKRPKIVSRERKKKKSMR